MSALTRLRARFPILETPASKREARLNIARELLEVLAIGRMVPATGYGYFDIEGGTLAAGVEDTYEAVALAMKVRGKSRCRVCAIGAACLVAVGLYDDAFDLENEYSLGYAGAGTMREVLARWFSRKQLDLIECAFERTDAYDGGQSSEPSRLRAEQFGWDNGEGEPRARLEAIFQNVIDNDGLFKP